MKGIALSDYLKNGFHLPRRAIPFGKEPDYNQLVSAVFKKLVKLSLQKSDYALSLYLESFLAS